MPKQTYKVTAATGYRGHQLGETFDAELTPEEEQRAVDRGSLRPVKKKTTQKEESSDG